MTRTHLPVALLGSIQNLHRPNGSLTDGMVLTHGAGGNSQAPLLIAIANAFADAGVCVWRYDLPFRQRKRFGPPIPSMAAEDRSGLRNAAAQLRSMLPGRVFLAGHSYGGRQASMLAAEDASVADGLLLLSYPLHPPNKVNQLRTEHFSQLRTPAMFVHGGCDPFGTLEELKTALELISAPTKLVQIENAGHDLRKGNFDVGTLVVRSFLVDRNAE